jgi:predicted metal-binding membrane protein
MITVRSAGCWALMLLMFVVGTGSLGWMLPWR